MTLNSKLGIGAGVLLVGGAIGTGIYFYKKNKEERESGSGNTGASVSPCVSRPSSNECKKEKCSAMMVVSERGGSSETSAQIIECKRLLGMSLNPCEKGAGRECSEWQKKQVQLVVSERGFDGRASRMIVYA